MEENKINVVTETTEEKKKNIELFKLQCKTIDYKFNKNKQVVTAIETFMSPLCGLKYKTVGVAKFNAEKDDKFDIEIGKKLAIAKAKKEAFTLFKIDLNKLLKTNKLIHDRLEGTVNQMNSYIEHQNEYIKTF